MVVDLPKVTSKGYRVSDGVDMMKPAVTGRRYGSISPTVTPLPMNFHSSANIFSDEWFLAGYDEIIGYWRALLNPFYLPSLLCVSPLPDR